jgi:hypothetical protein
MTTRTKKHSRQYLKLYKLSLIDKDYGKVNDIAVIAKTEKQARQIAGKDTGDMDWNDDSRSKCRELTLDSSPQVVLSEFWEESSDDNQQDKT